MHIKVPEGCIRKASALGLREEIIAYFKMKTVNEQGYFAFGSGIKDAALKLSVTERTVRRWISRMQEAGFIYKDDNGYGLVKYDTAYKILGFDTTPHKRKKRLGNFKIFKINTNNVHELLTTIVKEEIALNQRRQEYMIKRRPTQISKPDNTVGNKNGVSLSCAGLAKLLGYKRSTGHRLEQKLLEKYPNTVFIDKHSEVVDTKPSLKTSRISGNGHYIQNGILFKTLCNRIYVHT